MTDVIWRDTGDVIWRDTDDVIWRGSAVEDVPVVAAISAKSNTRFLYYYSHQRRRARQRV